MKEIKWLLNKEDVEEENVDETENVEEKENVDVKENVEEEENVEDEEDVEIFEEIKLTIKFWVEEALTSLMGISLKEFSKNFEEN